MGKVFGMIIAFILFVVGLRMMLNPASNPFIEVVGGIIAFIGMTIGFCILID